MAKIKLEHISIKNRTIFVLADIAKNREAGVVTLPKKVLLLMVDLNIFNNPSDSYLFSTDFMPGFEYVNEKKFETIGSGKSGKNFIFQTHINFTV